MASCCLWWTKFNQPVSTLVTFPGLAALTDREVVILQLEGTEIPEPELTVIEVSQNPTAASARSKVLFPAIVPRCRQYLTSRCRLLTGSPFFLSFHESNTYKNKNKLNKAWKQCSSRIYATHGTGTSSCSAASQMFCSATLRGTRLKGAHA